MSFITTTQDVFQQLIQSQQTSFNMGLGGVLAVIIIVFVVAAPLALIILRVIDNTILLFGHLTTG